MPFTNSKLYTKVQAQMMSRRRYHLYVSRSSYNRKGKRRVPSVVGRSVTREQDRVELAAFSLAHDLWT